MIITAYCQGITGEIADTRSLRKRLTAQAAREIRIRVQSAIAESGKAAGVADLMRKYDFPCLGDRFEGSPAGFDLAFALDIMGVKLESDVVVIGELSLSGDVRSVRGLLPMLVAAEREGATRALIPVDQWIEANSMKWDLELVAVRHLRQIIEGQKPTPPHELKVTWDAGYQGPQIEDLPIFLMETFNEVSLAACGGNNVLLVGCPGSGKTMIARRIVKSIVPMDEAETDFVRLVRSAVGLPYDPHPRRPFRAPHHTASTASIVGGGGSRIRPGEVTLAHMGVLFLDELPEFSRQTLQSLALTLRQGETRIDRYGRWKMPAKPIVIAAMNPCPCGWYASRKKKCACSKERIQRYSKRTHQFVEDLDMTVVTMLDPSIKTLVENSTHGN